MLITQPRDGLVILVQLFLVANHGGVLPHLGGHEPYFHPKKYDTSEQVTQRRPEQNHNFEIAKLEIMSSQR